MALQLQHLVPGLVERFPGLLQGVEGVGPHGVATEADVLSRPGDRVCDVMTSNVASVSEDTPAEEIAGIFARYGVKRVPVCRGRQPVGIVSRADIVRAIGQFGGSPG